MNNPGNKNQRKLPLATTALVSLALTLPLLANHTVADDEYRYNVEQTTTRETRADFVSFPHIGRTDRSVTVTWADLNLGHPAGLDQLYLRLTQATKAVCSPRADIRDTAMHRDHKACLETAMDNAVSNVGHLGLEEMHASRTGRSMKPGQDIAKR